VTPKEQKTLTQVIQANRRALSLLDKRIDDLVKTHPSLLAEYDVEDKQPFFYSAVGADGEAGIPITVVNVGENPAFGYVRTHPDSAFVLTRIHAAVTSQFTTGLPPVTDVTTGYGVGFGFRFYDESSSRWITFTNQNAEPQQKAVLPSSAFTPYTSLNEGGFALPSECVFPRSAVIRVEAYVQQFPPDATRLQVVFGGYKVYGG
jgi:hypothetical protein